MVYANCLDDKINFFCYYYEYISIIYALKLFTIDTINFNIFHYIREIFML